MHDALGTEHNIHIEKHTIRLYYYIGSLSAVVLLAVILSVIFTQTIRAEFNTKIEQLSNGLIQEKIRFLHNAVDRTIFYIDEERKRVRNDHAGCNLPPQDLEKIAISHIKDHLNKLRLVDDGYIWINRIVNYDGGDNYAVREIHPNLPETEGMWLSTATTDIKGNKPYAVELEGIKKDGELFFDYYFKKLNSERIEHKMSYAKLYKPYDWVVATGVYLDDVDQLVKAERERMDATYRSKRMVAMSVAVAIVILCTMIIIFFERQVVMLIASYEEKSREYTNSLQKLSCTDQLTGLYNRVKIDEVFQYESQQFKRHNSPFSILLLDIDNFKHVNDTHGHQVGDRILNELSCLLEANSRTTDTLGRWGGEEFLLICPETGHQGAIRLAEAIRQTIEAHNFEAVGKLTCSIGVSTFTEGDCPETLLSRADKALYRAKSNGRNRVESESES